MSRCVVDTNVAIIANGRPDPEDAKQPSLDCRMATVTFLIELLQTGTVLLDRAGEIQAEYRKHLNAAGQPGTGDRFYREVLHSSPKLVERVDLPKRADGQYTDLPQSLIDAGFDPSDRKFAALGHKEGAPVYNATDSDWVNHAVTLQEEQIRVEHLCGCDPAAWFAP